jgi:hypothetical protein
MVLFFWGSNVFNQYGNNSTVASTIPFLISCPSLSNLDFSKYKCGVAPNPSKGIFYHINRKFLEDAIIISVVDLNGRTIYNSNLKNLSNQALDLNHLQMAFIFSIFPIRVLIVLKNSKTIKLKIMKKLYFYLCTKTWHKCNCCFWRNATGSGGSSSYTVGQVFYTNAVGSNGSINQGATTG